MSTNFFIEGEHYPTIEEVKEILIPKGHEFNKGREPESFEALQTSDDKDLGDSIIMGSLKNLIIIKTKSIDGKIMVISYSTNTKSAFTAYDLNLGLIDRVQKPVYLTTFSRSKLTTSKLLIFQRVFPS